MVKVSAEVVQDAISKNGRLIGVSWKTDDELINKILSTPRVWRNTFGVTVTNGQIRKHFKREVISSVNSANDKLKEEGLTGKKMVFEI